MRQMYDSDNIDDIPDTAEVVAFYCDGEPGTPTAQQLDRFQGKTLVPITRKTGVKAKVADIEPGCIWPPTDARPHFDQGDSDTAYCDWNDHQEVIDALTGSPNFQGLWIASYDGVQELPVIPGVNVVAKQYANPTTSGGHYDLSVISDEWPVPVTAPPQEVQPVTTEPEPDYKEQMDEPVPAADGKERLDAPIVDAVWVAGGCYMVAADGGVFVRDAAVFHGSMAGHTLNADVVSILVADHTGYTLVAADGGTFRFGNGPEVQAL